MSFGSSKNSSNQQSTSNSTSNQSSSSTSSSSNQAYGDLKGLLTPTVQAGGNATNAITSLLNGDQSGLDAYLNSGNYNFTRDQGIAGITANNAAKGLLNSGSTLKSSTAYSSNLAQTYLDKYLSTLTGLQSSGGSAASILAGAGQVSNSSSTSTGSSLSNSNSTGTSNGKSTNFSTN